MKTSGEFGRGHGARAWWSSAACARGEKLARTGGASRKLLRQVVGLDAAGVDLVVALAHGDGQMRADALGGHEHLQELAVDFQRRPRGQLRHHAGAAAELPLAAVAVGQRARCARAG